MTDPEIAKLYKQIETEIDNLKIGKVREYKYPEFTKIELMTIPRIVEYLQAEKYKETIEVKEPSTMRIEVTKLQAEETQQSVFNNLTSEKSENEIQAEKAHNNCISKKHSLTKSNQATFGGNFLVCEQCKLGYTYQLNSGTTKVKNVFKI